jgi:Histidine kinase-, DNA gyrase B-, and HSP90-like ATPase
MSLATLHPIVSKSHLVRSLAKATSVHGGTDFDYVGEFVKLASKVTREVAYVSAIFPEYTPHDADLHLARLFSLSDQILGTERYKHLSAAELFLLAAGLYAHDWGMAVSESEKRAIAGDASSRALDDFCLLQVERMHLAHAAATPDSFRPLTSWTSAQWQDYIRNTHASRSAQRVRSFFATSGGAVGDVLASICEGHAVDFQLLEQDAEFPTQRGVLNQIVNVRALAVYVRLIDLLDISDARTPYTVWRFVDPRDAKSQREWAKHRAIHAVTFPKYQHGRRVRVDGETSDPDVYAALQDLRRYCDAQLRGCNDILAAFANPIYHLDLVDLQWEVKAKDFSPVDIRFEFHRDAMFQILSSEIYQGDPYVFLREILQNSIDAIRVRRAMRSRSKLSPIVDDAIYFDVTREENGTSTVRCCDSGIGMDERVIRNYLSVAGQSYYHSTDFERLAVHVDPISRFGIGILSCFMVADRIELRTYKDPELFPGAKPLRVEIPSVDKQFRVFTDALNDHNGTTVSVSVNHTKLVGSVGNKIPKSWVTQYLSTVAAFSEFPIVVREEGQTRVILKPGGDTSAASSRFGPDAEYFQLTPSFDWNEVFELPVGADAKRLFSLHKIDVRKHLQMEDYEGTVLLILPNNVGNFELESGSLHLTDSESAFRRPIRCFGAFGSYNPRFVEGFARSAKRHPALAIYCDGILLPEVDGSFLEGCVCAGLPVPQVQVNIPRRRAKILDISRAVIRSDPSAWAIDLSHSITDYIARIEIPKLKRLEANKRLVGLGTLMRLYQLNARKISQYLDRDHWPLAYLTRGGAIQVRDWDLDNKTEIALAPPSVGPEIGKLFSPQRFSTYGWHNLERWKGDSCLILSLETDRNQSALAALRFVNGAVNEEFTLSAIRFLHPALSGSEPIAQPILRRRSLSIFDADTIEVQLAAGEITPFASFRRFVESRGAASRMLSQMVPFLPPFGQMVSCDGQWWNFDHPFCRRFVQLIVAFDSYRRRGLLKESDEITISDAIVQIDTGLKERRRVLINAALAEAWTAANTAGISEICDEPPKLQSKEYLWGKGSDAERRRKLTWDWDEAAGTSYGQVIATIRTD